MKTKYLAAFAATAFSAALCFAQEPEAYQSVTIEEVPSPDTYIPGTQTVVWGIKGVIDAELPHAEWTRDGDKQRMFNSGFGASIGGLANIYLGRNFYFEPGLALTYVGYSYNNVMRVAPNSPSVNGGPNIYKLGLRLPAVFGYFINISEKWGLDVFTGPVLDYTFYGTAKSQNDEVKQNYDLMHVFRGDYAQRRFNLGWRVGVGFPVNNFLISLEADIGITDMLKGPLTLRENRVGLGVTYYFVGQ